MRKKVSIFAILMLLILNYFVRATKHELSIYDKIILKAEINHQSSLTREQNKVPILMYHHLAYDSTKWNYCIISPDKFKKEMLYLKALGYTTIFFKDYVAYKENGARLPDNPIIITFDDGYYSNYEYAYPILKELNMKATISVIGWSVGREYYKDDVTPITTRFTWKQAKEMYDSGLIDIQNHSYDLHNSDASVKGVEELSYETQTEYEKRFKEDTLKMKKLIESNVGSKVIVYTYPYGIYNKTSEKVLKELGFKVSLIAENGISDMNNGLYLLKRVNMPSHIKSKELINEILQLQNRNIKMHFHIIEKLKNFSRSIK